MSKCKRCGRLSIFKKVNNEGFCENCTRIIALTEEEEAITNKLKDTKENYDAIYKKLKEDAKSEALNEIKTKIASSEKKLHELDINIEAQSERLDNLINNRKTEEKKLESAASRLLKIQTKLKSVRSGLKHLEQHNDESVLDEDSINEISAILEPTMKIHFHSLDVRELRKRFTQNSSVIKETLQTYQQRYKTKANLAIYQLMIIGLEAELQNVLTALKYTNKDKVKKSVKDICEKYENIASSGNQSIAPTVKSFIGEISFLYDQAVEIEYEYYVKKERIKEEQKMLRQQMKEEAEERKRLAEERKKIEEEERKYLNEIESLRKQLDATQDDEKRAQIIERIDGVNGLLDRVEEQKDGILRLQNGKAGYVYIISNLGSFGENVFKIGMTRRLEPLDRVRELGDASVPFRYDVHSLIFSENAPALENSLHKNLHQKRLNKINLRREFFSLTIDEVEELVYELEPSAEFVKTMLAEEYRRSLEIESIDDDFISDDDLEEEDLEEDENEIA